MPPRVVRVATSDIAILPAQEALSADALISPGRRIGGPRLKAAVRRADRAIDLDLNPSCTTNRLLKLRAARERYLDANALTIKALRDLYGAQFKDAVARAEDELRSQPNTDAAHAAYDEACNDAGRRALSAELQVRVLIDSADRIAVHA